MLLLIGHPVIWSCFGMVWPRTDGSGLVWPEADGSCLVLPKTDNSYIVWSDENVSLFCAYYAL
jgi:hypothetical protein